jgi:HD-like signal output (HDOD) protein
LSDLASLIGRDPVLAARVLQASNRAATAKGRGVITTIGDAVRVVGCTAIRDIAASVGIFDAMPAPSKDGFDPIRSWQHSLAVATISSRIAPAELAGTAYLIGLCHDLGEILFRTHFGWEYNHVLQARAASGNPLHELERQMLGVSHGELVRTILQCLELPEVIAHPIVSFHESAAHGGTPPDRLGRILQIADLYATGMLLSSSEESTVRPLSRSECRAATDVDAPGRLDGAQLRGEIYAMTALYARTASQGQGNLTKPFFGRRAVSLFVAREGSLSSFDPTCAALESLGEVTVRESLPTAWEMVGYNGLVVITRTDTVRGFGTGDIMAAASRGDGPFVPTLWLAGSAGMHIPASAGEVVPRSWVTSLKELADFVGVCQGREVTHT